MVLCDTNIFISAFNGRADVQIDAAISERAIHLIEKYKLSHGLEIPDAIIAATSVEYEIPLFTYNVKDFDFIPKLVLY